MATFRTSLSGRSSDQPARHDLFILSEAFNILSSLVPLEEKHTAELGVGSEVYVPKGALKACYLSNNAQWSKEDIKSLYLEHVLPTLTIKMPKTLKPRPMLETYDGEAWEKREAHISDLMDDEDKWEREAHRALSMSEAFLSFRKRALAAIDESHRRRSKSISGSLPTAQADQMKGGKPDRQQAKDEMVVEGASGPADEPLEGDSTVAAKRKRGASGEGLKVSAPLPPVPSSPRTAVPPKKRRTPLPPMVPSQDEVPATSMPGAQAMQGGNGKHDTSRRDQHAQTTLVDERTQAVLQALAELEDGKLRAKIYALRVKDEGAFGRAVANQQLEGQLQGTIDTLTVLANSMFP